MKSLSENKDVTLGNSRVIFELDKRSRGGGIVLYLKCRETQKVFEVSRKVEGSTLKIKSFTDLPFSTRKRPNGRGTL